MIGGEAAEDEDAPPGTNLTCKGLCQLCEIKLGFFDFGKKSKRSSELALRIIHRMLTDRNY